MLTLHHILVPVDFSEHAAVALAHAVELARAHDATIDLLHVIEEPTFPSFYGAGQAVLYDEKPDLQARAHEAMDELMASFDPPRPTVAYHVAAGRAGAAILDFADQHRVDLIVISTHGRTGVQRLMLGSVAQKVVGHAPCSVFVVKSAVSSLVPGRPPVDSEAG